MLESSRTMGSGARVSLRFEPEVKIRGSVKGMGGIGLFPGAIVALRGKNGGGGWFLVTEILAVSPSCLSQKSFLSDIMPAAASQILTLTSWRQSDAGRRFFVFNVHCQWTVHLRRRSQVYTLAQTFGDNHLNQTQRRSSCISCVFLSSADHG
jgi:hypothetical protein